ncbi:MAG: divalent metal cation transporter [Acidimicrobiales bacterium]
MALLRSVGPEMLAGAADNDPTNIGTAAALGATTMYQLAWLALLVAPLLAVVQTIAAQVGSVTRSDLQTLTRERFGRRVAATLMVSVVIVNVATIAADLQAGAAGIGILAGVDSRWLVVPLGLGVVALLLIGRYEHVVGLLRYLLLGFVSFAVAAFLAHPDWSVVIRSSLVPTLSLRSGVVTGGVALLGTTLTSYVYMWETIGRGREEPPTEADSGRGLARAKLGAVIGAVFTAVIFWFMLVAVGATLGGRHETVTSASQAAHALRPLAGSLAADLFAIGLVVSAVVALPVLLATTAYVVGAQFDWRRGLSQPISHAREFYAVLVASIALGFAVTFAKVSVIGMLLAASVIGGLGTPFGLVVMVLLARDRSVMGTDPISRRLALAGWAVALVVGAFGAFFVVASALGN